MAKKKYEGKYAEMAEQFRKDGCDEDTIAKFIREEMEHDRLEENWGVTDIKAAREWQKIPEEEKELLLNSAYCHNCKHTSFRSDYNLQIDKFGIIIQGYCAKCGAKIARCNY